MKHRRRRQIDFLIGLLLLTPFISPSAEVVISSPAISIIIDDIGYRLRDDLRALSLPGAVTIAIMPHSPHAEKMSRMASLQGKAILLHLPMQAVEQEKNKFLGPGALTLNMTREEFMHTLDEDLRSVPNAIGVNNHMGSLLTRHPGHMEWLMSSLHSNKKFYIDSMTSKQSIVSRIAREKKVPYMQRDIFLDNEQDVHYIQAQFKELIKVAKQKGRAIAIGHPHPTTIQVLMKELQRLDEYGVRLVNINELLANPYGKTNNAHVLLSN